MSSSKISAFVAQCGLNGSNKLQNNESIGKSVEWITIHIPEGETFHGKMSSVRIKSICCDSRKAIILNSVKKHAAAAAAAKSLQSCLTLCDPIDGGPRGSPVPGILQARTLEWVAISFSNAWKWKVKVKSLSRVWLLATPWTTAHQALRPWDFPGKSTGVGCHCLLR